MTEDQIVELIIASSGGQDCDSCWSLTAHDAKLIYNSLRDAGVLKEPTITFDNGSKVHLSHSDNDQLKGNEHDTFWVCEKCNAPWDFDADECSRKHLCDRMQK